MTLVSYKIFSVSLRSVHGNVHAMCTQCANTCNDVLVEELTATVVLNFTRCHLKTIDNRHVITIYIQYTSFWINFNVDSN